ALLHAAVTQAVRLHASSYSCRTLGALAVSPPAPAIAVNRARLSSSDVTTNPATPPSPAPLAATHRAGCLTRQSVAGSPPGKRLPTPGRLFQFATGLAGSKNHMMPPTLAKNAARRALHGQSRKTGYPIADRARGPTARFQTG